MKAWQQQGHRYGRVSVNVSGLQLKRGHFQKVVNDALNYAELEPKHLELELTENVLMPNTTRAMQVLDALKSQGIQIAIDDFGKGYSSLSYLERLPVDKLKIDKSFVADISGSSSHGAIARAVVALAKSLNLKVTAEGVETQEQRAFMFSEGCDDAQGFLFGKPMPASAFAELATIS